MNTSSKQMNIVDWVIYGIGAVLLFLGFLVNLFQFDPLGVAFGALGAITMGNARMRILLRSMKKPD